MIRIVGMTPIQRRNQFRVVGTGAEAQHRGGHRYDKAFTAELTSVAVHVEDMRERAEKALALTIGAQNSQRDAVIAGVSSNLAALDELIERATKVRDALRAQTEDVDVVLGPDDGEV